MKAKLLLLIFIARSINGNIYPIDNFISKNGIHQYDPHKFDNEYKVRHGLENYHYDFYEQPNFNLDGLNTNKYETKTVNHDFGDVETKDYLQSGSNKGDYFYGNQNKGTEIFHKS